MRISSIKTMQKSIVYKSNFNNKLFLSPFQRQKDNCDSFVKNNFNPQPKELSFRGLPYKLPISYTLYSCDYTGADVFDVFKKFKLGNYLDLNGNSKDEKAREIRSSNLKVLNYLYTPKDKKYFIAAYEDYTGFPDMKEVSSRIKSEFVSASEKAQNILQKKYPEYSSAYEIVAMGYDGVSSVAKETAFPGSDLDKAYVILKGSDDDLENEITVQNFKAELWKNTDQIILSYNHDVSAFPEIYTEKQINSMCKAINKAAGEMNLFHQETVRKPIKILGIFNSFKEEKKPSKYSFYRELTDSFSEDYVGANKFIIDLANKFPANYTWQKPINVSNPSREDIYKSSFIIESISHGERLKGEDFKLPINKRVADLINLSQIQSLKKKSSLKEKYIKRKNIQNDYKYWSTDKKIAFIKSMIKASCSDNNEFPEYYTTTEEDKFKQVLDALYLGGNN